MEKLLRFFKDEEGVTAIEYALIAALISVAVIGTLTLWEATSQPCTPLSRLRSSAAGLPRPEQGPPPIMATDLSCK